MAYPLIGLFGLLGLLVGALLNLIIARFLSEVPPDLLCPECHSPRSLREKVPFISWILPRGKCRSCGATRRFLSSPVECGTALVFALLAWHFGWSPILPAFLYLGGAGMTLISINVRTGRLPDAIVLPSYFVALALLTAGAIAGGDPKLVIRACLGGLALGGAYFLLALVYPKGMGFGAVKFSVLLGLYLGYVGWLNVLIGGFLAFALGGLLGVVMLRGGHAKRNTVVQFGPMMFFGALVAIVLV